MRIKIVRIWLLPALLLTIFTGTGCVKDEPAGNTSGGDAYVSVSAKATIDINEDNATWEDRIDELRMLAFNTSDGKVAYNEKLYFPNGFNQSSKAVRMLSGNYDFYFIANETAYPGDFVAALLGITDKSEFATDPGFGSPGYDPDFIPDGTSSGGRFLMSSVYENITILPGGTEQNPARLPLPTNNKAEMVRPMAKVEVIFRKKENGSTLPDNAVTSIRLHDVAANLSVPPHDSYYAGPTTESNYAPLSGLNFNNDSIGAVTFYIPELLVEKDNSDIHTRLVINNRPFPILSDNSKTGLLYQRRNISNLSDSSVIRNYHYKINAYINTTGEIEIRVFVEPWNKETYIYIFDGDKEIIIPPIIPTDSSIVMPTDCGKIEILSATEDLTLGLQGAYNDYPDYNNNTIIKGNPPYYCEQKYGEGWRLINSCELMSFLAVCDISYQIWMSNTWTANSKVPVYPLRLRQAAQNLLEVLSGDDLSGTELVDENIGKDNMNGRDISMLYAYFTPGDLMERPDDYPNGWPYPGGTNGESWYYYEAAIQLKPFWAEQGYVDLNNRDNWYKVLYGNFQRYEYNGTKSRCIREVE